MKLDYSMRAVVRKAAVWKRKHLEAIAAQNRREINAEAEKEKEKTAKAEEESARRQYDRDVAA